MKSSSTQKLDGSSKSKRSKSKKTSDLKCVQTDKRTYLLTKWMCCAHSTPQITLKTTSSYTWCCILHKSSTRMCIFKKIIIFFKTKRPFTTLRIGVLRWLSMHSFERHNKKIKGLVRSTKDPLCSLANNIQLDIATRYLDAEENVGKNKAHRLRLCGRGKFYRHSSMFILVHVYFSVY